MPHEISNTPDGEDAMVYVGQTPWHRRGTQLDASSSRDLDLALEKAGLGFDVEKRPRHELEVLDSDDPGPPDIARDGVRYRLKRAEKPFSVIRTDTGTELGVVDDVWHPLQNRDAFEPLRAALDEGLASIETGGVLRDGKEVWILVRFDREHVLRTARDLPGGGKRPAFRRLEDTLEREPGGGILPYGLFYNDHSGSRDARVKQTAVRVVCANTLETSLRRRGGFSVEIPHHSSVRQAYAEAVRNLFRGLAEGCQELADHREVLKKSVLSEEAFSKLVLEVAVPFGYLERMQEKQKYPQMSAAVERLLRPLKAKRTEIRRLWEGGAGHQGDRSAWEAYNGLVQWLDHSASASREEDRIESLMTGRLSDTKRRVFARLVAHAKRGPEGAEFLHQVAAGGQEQGAAAEGDVLAQFVALNAEGVHLERAELEALLNTPAASRLNRLRSRGGVPGVVP